MEQFSESPQPRIRAGHADRDRVIDILTAATAEGRLTLEELEMRMEAASAARFQSELQDLIVDLPAGHAPVAPLPAIGEDRTPATREAVVLRAAYRGIVRAGRWTVPEWIIAEPTWSAVVLNMLEAVPPPNGRVTIELRGAWGSFVLIVPEGWGVEHEQMRTGQGWSWVTFDAPTVAAAGKPQIRLIGDSREGRVAVRGPRWWDEFLHHTSRG